MELWMIIVVAVVCALMMGLIVYSVIKYNINHKKYAEDKRMARVISDKKVLKEIKETRKSGRSGCVFDGKISEELINKIRSEGHDVDEYTDNRGYPCTRIYYKD